ncbi:MAG: DUF1816 domain-containing protein [Oscillatoriales cyanobacterium]|nr:MAG: DUF1816 domain-containing protein [Oscillatoriales cyanobacterium]TAD98742.1 MAG: DUF1816 domain-containing protein [Oscillatoriales cyanobacterium]TAE06995.1 MAG: DUF1816 domain-containing protein [Oscillatoriales cyanobacterium]TAE98275.1 MAG: DUF1816 domain-containing protein [Oscillatoriales cyanobacterium]TAF47412.1 MAG: DUF1816 domain-containing protein [Oscillatoriales cyanobacterium]
MFGFSMFAMYVIAFLILTQPMSSGRNRDWWVEVDTDSPNRTYYFGPYRSKDEAENSTIGYIRDLERKGAKKISIDIKQGRQPSQLQTSEE